MRNSKRSGITYIPTLTFLARQSLHPLLGMPQKTIARYLIIVLYETEDTENFANTRFRNQNNLKVRKDLRRK